MTDMSVQSWKSWGTWIVSSLLLSALVAIASLSYSAMTKLGTDLSKGLQEMSEDLKEVKDRLQSLEVQVARQSINRDEAEAMVKDAEQRLNRRIDRLEERVGK